MVAVTNEEILESLEAEGYYASACIKKISDRHGIYMPVADMVYEILTARI